MYEYPFAKSSCSVFHPIDEHFLDYSIKKQIYHLYRMQIKHISISITGAGRESVPFFHSGGNFQRGSVVCVCGRMALINVSESVFIAADSAWRMNRYALPVK